MFHHCVDEQADRRCRNRRRRSQLLGTMWLCLLSAGLVGCNTDQVLYGSVAGTIVGAQSPTSEVEQTYYLGVFDEQEQLPAQVYRVRLRGQASSISFTKFASGWLPADVVDTLGTTITFDKEQAAVTLERDPNIGDNAVPTGRKLILFGPEGFRRAPKGHRLVVVMGSSPQTYFDAVSRSLGSIAAVTQGRAPAITDRELFHALVQLKAERDRLNAVTLPIRIELERVQ